jgi:putative FmdB family regulatory protein
VEDEMAVYDYRCGKCGKKFSVTMSISEHGSKRLRCPKCNSLRVAQQVSAFYAQTSKKS